MHAGSGRSSAVFELMAHPDANIDFAGAMQDAGHLVLDRCGLVYDSSVRACRCCCQALRATLPIVLVQRPTSCTGEAGKACCL